MATVTSTSRPLRLGNVVARTILYSLRPASSSGACPTGVFAPGELFGVQFLSVTTGWTVGSNEVLTTDDGGLRWTVQYRARCADLTEVDFVDPEHGWAVGLTDLLVTTDGGRHWQQLHEPAWPVRFVHFVSSRVGYAVAGGGISGDWSPMTPWTGGVVLKTLDGGQSWTLLDAPADAQSVCFSTPDDGWLGADGRVYRSLDGGRSWSLALKGYGPGEDRPLAMV
ncbi:MAG: YCF48-related protein, partial [Acidimicrobiales bacterium]